MKSINKILLVHTGGLGDLIMARPAIQTIRKRYSDCRIDFLGNPHSLPVLRKDRSISNFIPFPSKRKNIVSSLKVLATLLRLRKVRYDLLFLLQPVLSGESHGRLLFLVKLVSPKHTIGRPSTFGDHFLDTAVSEDPRLHEVERMLSVAEYGHIGERISFEYLLAETFGDVKNRLLDSGRPYAVLGPGGTKITRRWQIWNFLELACRLSTLGLDIVFVGDGREKGILSGKESLLPPRTVNLIGRTDIEELASIIRKAKLAIANDSGPMHLANALGIPVVGIFGSGDVVRTRPYLDEKSRVVTSLPMDCKPCYVETCTTPTCMDDITVEEVWKAVRELLKSCKEQNVEKNQA